MNSLAISVFIFSFVLSVWSTPLSQECSNSGKTCLLRETCCHFKEESTTGCCPLNNAVCCEDQAHCCPQGYDCSDSALLCQKQEYAPVRKTPIHHTIPLRRIEKYGSSKTVETVTCNDQISVCAEGDTCCHLVSGMWGCCPLSSARCCEDGVHCCPSGYECDDENEGYCKHVNSSVSISPPWVKASLKYKAMHKDDFVAIELYGVCVDNSVCPGNFTCCALDDAGDYGCCSGSKSVCCADRKSWCPQGYACDLARGECKHDTTN